MSTLMVGEFAVVVGRPDVESTVIAVVVALLMRPDLRLPDFTGSAMSITMPGLRIMPDSIDTAKLTVSVRFC
jgi:hypothetical protein